MAVGELAVEVGWVGLGDVFVSVDHERPGLVADCVGEVHEGASFADLGVEGFVGEVEAVGESDLVACGGDGLVLFFGGVGVVSWHQVPAPVEDDCVGYDSF